MFSIVSQWSHIPSPTTFINSSLAAVNKTTPPLFKKDSRLRVRSTYLVPDVISVFNCEHNVATSGCNPWAAPGPAGLGNSRRFVSREEKEIACEYEFGATREYTENVTGTVLRCDRCTDAM